MWTKFLYVLVAVTSGLLRRINGAKEGPFVSLVAPEGLLQSGKKTSAYLGMDPSLTIGSLRLTKMAQKLCPELEPVGIKTVSIPTI